MKNTVNIFPKPVLLVLRDIYDGTTLLRRSLPDIKSTILSESLRVFLQEQTESIRTQQERLEGIFAVVNEDPLGGANEKVRNCMDAFAKVRENLSLGEFQDGTWLVCHQKITSNIIELYQCVIPAFITLELPDITRILKRSLLVEQQVKARLTVIEEIQFCVEKIV